MCSISRASATVKILALRGKVHGEKQAVISHVQFFLGRRSWPSKLGPKPEDNQICRLGPELWPDISQVAIIRGRATGTGLDRNRVGQELVSDWV